MRELALLLGLSSALRLLLAVQGGQAYWPDERLYTQLLDVWDRPSWGAFAAALLGQNDHLGFALAGALPAGMHRAASAASGIPADRLLLLPALVFSQASVAAIALVYAVARRAGAAAREALVAALLMACSAALFYGARHLLPYDTSLALGLLALWCGLGRGPLASVACGAIAGAAFVTYNGYWLLAGTALVVHVLAPVRSIADWPGVLRRAAGGAAGLAAAPLGIMAVQTLVGAPLLLPAMRRLAGTITDGYLPEGAQLPWAYLWHAEHTLLLAWLAALVFLALDRRPWAPGRRRAAWQWTLAAGFVYAGLAVGSSLLHVFVVMGRQSRQLIPFLCLAAAPAIVEAVRRTTPRAVWTGIALAGLGLSTVANFRTPLTQRFPRTLEAQIEAKYGPVRLALAVEGPPEPQPGPPDARWVLVNAAHLYPPRASRPVPPGPVVVRFPHPLEFRPYQYEGFDPLERLVLETTDISMRLVDAGAQPPAAAGGPAPGR